MALAEKERERELVENLKNTESRKAYQEDRSIADVFKYLGDLIGSLVHDLSQLITLRMDLLKSELRDTVNRVATHSVKIVIAAGLGFFGAIILNATVLIALGGLIPIRTPYNFALAGFVMTAGYGIAAYFLFIKGLREFKIHAIRAEQLTDRAKKKSAEILDNVQAETSKVMDDMEQGVGEASKSVAEKTSEAVEKATSEVKMSAAPVPTVDAPSKPAAPGFADKDGNQKKDLYR